MATVHLFHHRLTAHTFIMFEGRSNILVGTTLTDMTCVALVAIGFYVVRSII